MSEPAWLSVVSRMRLVWTVLFRSQLGTPVRAYLHLSTSGADSVAASIRSVAAFEASGPGRAGRRYGVRHGIVNPVQAFVTTRSPSSDATGGPVQLTCHLLERTLDRFIGQSDSIGIS